jgi:hypothetical protein
VDKKYFEQLVKNVVPPINDKYKYVEILSDNLIISLIDFDLVNNLSDQIIINAISWSTKIKQLYYKKYPNKKFNFDNIINHHSTINLETFYNLNYLNDEIKVNSTALLKKILTTNKYNNVFIDKFITFLIRYKYYTKQELITMASNNNSINLLNMLLNLNKNTKIQSNKTMIHKKVIAKMFTKNAAPSDLKKSFCNYIVKNYEITLTNEEIMYLLAIKHPLMQAIKSTPNYNDNNQTSYHDMFENIKKKLHDKFNVDDFLEMKNKKETNNETDNETKKATKKATNKETKKET